MTTALGSWELCAACVAAAPVKLLLLSEITVGFAICAYEVYFSADMDTK